MNIILFIAIGLLIGLVAEKVLKKRSYKLDTYITIAIIGSILGGLVIDSLDFTSDYDCEILSLFASLGGGIMMIGLGYLVSRQ